MEEQHWSKGTDSQLSKGQLFWYHHPLEMPLSHSTGSVSLLGPLSPVMSSLVLPRHKIAIFRQLLRGWRARPVSVVPCQLSTTRSLVLGIFLGVTQALDRSTKQQIWTNSKLSLPSALHTFQRTWEFLLSEMGKNGQIQGKQMQGAQALPEPTGHTWSCKHKGNCPTVMQFNSFWMDGEGGSEQLQHVHSFSVSPATRDGPWEQLWPCRDCLEEGWAVSSNQGSPVAPSAQPGRFSAVCWPRTPSAAGQAEHWVVTHCLFLCPAATSAVHKPCTSGNRRHRERRHSYVLLILFSFESSNSFQFTYSRRSPTQKFSGSCMNNPKTMQIKLAGQKQLESGPQASAVICLEEGDGRQDHLPSELSCRITSPQVLNLLVSLQA